MAKYHDAKFITELSVRDVRFPTALNADGSDAMHSDPDYSCAYVELSTDTDLKGYGFTFTIGRGTEIVVSAVKALSPKVVGQSLQNIFENFAAFWRNLTSDPQLRWVGPEKGVIHLAVAAVVNALWDIWAKKENKPLWKLLTDMEPEQLISVIDFRYISDVLTETEAIDILKRNYSTKHIREKEIKEIGYPSYCTSVGWLGYSDEKIRKLCREARKSGFTMFKVKVGANLEDDKRRLSVVREEIGSDNILMVDANQRWDVHEAIAWMKELSSFRPLWIEEPTSPDDILGHAAIAKGLQHLGIGVATGEQCQNRVIFKQLMQANALQFCQIDSCRLGGVNEILAVYLMATKFGIPVCPHAGGVGLCELVQHLAVWDYTSVSASLQNRMIEYVDHLHEHFVYPINVRNSKYMVPENIGYSSEIKESSLSDHEFPNGNKWKELFKQKKYKSINVPGCGENISYIKI